MSKKEKSKIKYIAVTQADQTYKNKTLTANLYTTTASRTSAQIGCKGTRGKAQPIQLIRLTIK